MKRQDPHDVAIDAISEVVAFIHEADQFAHSIVVCECSNNDPDTCRDVVDGDALDSCVARVEDCIDELKRALQALHAMRATGFDEDAAYEAAREREWDG